MASISEEWRPFRIRPSAGLTESEGFLVEQHRLAYPKGSEKLRPIFFINRNRQLLTSPCPKSRPEHRTYIPIAFLPPDIIASNKLYVVESKDIYLFGVLSSSMHMAWVKVVAGRLKSDFQYSGTMVYNTFPWPVEPTDKQKAKVRAAAEDVLKQRTESGDGRLGFLPKANEKGWRCSLATLYDPLAMPKPLVRAHAQLDRAVERIFDCSEPFHPPRAVDSFLALRKADRASPARHPKGCNRRAKTADNSPPQAPAHAGFIWIRPARHNLKPAECVLTLFHGSATL